MTEGRGQKVSVAVSDCLFTCSNKACNAGVISVYSCLLFFPYQTVGTKLMAVCTFYASAAAAADFYSAVGAYIAVCSWKKGKKGKNKIDIVLRRWMKTVNQSEVADCCTKKKGRETGVVVSFSLRLYFTALVFTRQRSHFNTLISPD